MPFFSTLTLVLISIVELSLMESYKINFFKLLKYCLDISVLHRKHNKQCLFPLSPFFTTTELRYATVYWNRAEKILQVRNTLDRSGDAYGFYNNSLQTTGWGVLEIRAGYGTQTLSNEDIMYVAGFLEGYLTAP